MVEAAAENLCKPTAEISYINPISADRALAMSALHSATSKRTAIMTERNTRKNLFKPSRSTKENKAAVTDRTARLILDAEAAKRHKKIEKLRKQRLAMEKQEGKCR